MLIRTKKGTLKEIIYNEKQLLNYGFNRLNERDFSRQELFVKMKNLQPDIEIVNKVLDYLEEKDYVSDTRRAKIILMQYQNKESINKIKQRLSQKGISKDDINEVIESFELNDQNEGALNLLLKKFKTYNPDNYQKMVRHLASKGYPYDNISKSLKMFKDGIDE